MSDQDRAKLQYATDMWHAADFLRIQLDVIQCMEIAWVRGALEDEILVDFIATARAIYHAYLSKSSPRPGGEMWLRRELHRAVNAIEPSPDGLERIRAQIEHTRDKGGKTTNGDLR